MTQQKAAAVVSALVTNGYVPSVSADGNGNWSIEVAVSGGISASTVSSFATAEGVTATVPSVLFT